MRVDPSTAPPVLAAGALAWREGKKGFEVLLVHRPRYDDWSVPKGKLDKGETFPAAAVREVAEETGYRVRLQRPLPASVYLLPDGRTKIVQYWTATVRAKVAAGAEDPREIDQRKWLSLDEAERRLTRQSDQVLLAALRRYLEAEELDTAAIIIQRHAAALSRAKWRKGEKSRPLNAKGKKQAAALPPLIDAFDPGGVVTSPWKRCRATVEGFARAQGIDVTTKSELTEASHADHPTRTGAVIERVLREARSVVVCTHRPVLPTVLQVIRQVSVHGAALELPRSDPYLAAGEAMVLHATSQGNVVAVERHLPNIG
ncbi:NUDIX hydrolase [Brachybacterium squillarum]|uniref:NUDIX hydrolase n=1 Tax=Brachybacterium squillarum TaxID=661979 RepID=UPI00026293D2|nr:NUDIX hydrolase [Brachybacterium squillarum]